MVLGRMERMTKAAARTRKEGIKEVVKGITRKVVVNSRNPSPNHHPNPQRSSTRTRRSSRAF
jgi:hypothetical protein